ncbi:PadR family transcriptional regulator [Natrinema caseinilyticum]|uniref:PadR family transcriptional regulator n=1 Tax=Natrinema caseinilyticum TaxID=2961570 RepID=UPI0020C40876|nr:PadR family transcriptional regulator [Natrinema caseinilyticum]
MEDHDSRGLESPARADASPHDRPRSDGRTTWTALTAFQRDCLEAIARRKRDGRLCDERGIAHTLGRVYPLIDRTWLYPNLTILVGRGLLSRRERPAERATEYRLTDEGRALLLQRVERFADACGMWTTAHGDAETERERARGVDEVAE